MTDCCRSLCGVSPKIITQIQSKLREISKFVPDGNCTYIVVLNSDGEIVAQENNSYKAPEELLSSIAVLQKTAIQFGSTLNQMECPIIHVRGSSHLFSCYEVDKNILAFYTAMHGAVLESFNTSELDSKIQNLLTELRLLLQNLIA